MGAEPAWALLSLSMPSCGRALARGIRRAACTRLPRRTASRWSAAIPSRARLSSRSRSLGFVPPAAALKRSGARAGDVVYVSGTPGEAAAGLELLGRGAAGFDSSDPRVRRFLHAEPRLAARAGRCADSPRRPWTFPTDCSATCASCRSERRRRAARPRAPADRRPCSPRTTIARECERFVLHGGDDYELLFTVPAGRVRASMRDRARRRHRSACASGRDRGGPSVQCLRDGRIE